MLRKEQNELLTRVGPGTPMGKLFRCFWLPVLLESELLEPDGSARPVRILGENLVAFRDTDGRVGLLDAQCPHRCASLVYGRNEERGLRCIYHGWKFDVDGRCVDMPSEPPERQNMKDKVRARAYPTQTAGGAIWAYMGAGEPPPFPHFEWTRFPADQTAVIKRFQPCNYAQAIEGGIDSAHISFLHRDLSDAQADEGAGSVHKRYATRCRHPQFSVEDTDYGLRVLAKRSIEGDPTDYWRVTQFMLPCFQMVPPPLVSGDHNALPVYGNVWVPIDDESTWNWGFSSDTKPLTPAQREFMGPHGLWGDLDEAFMPQQNPANSYEFSLQRQRTQNFSGIRGVRNQDAAVVESMGLIVDRAREHLGHSDSAVIQFRRKMIRLAEAVHRGDISAATVAPELYNIRSVSVLVRSDARLADVLAPLERGALQ
jgi:phenylpropionate dioxygenase-like ring-hydroxylating dioxygenase large terminal subunit